MAGYHVGQRCLNRPGVYFTLETQCERNVVSSTRPLHPIEEPETSLGIRERQKLGVNCHRCLSIRGSPDPRAPLDAAAWGRAAPSWRRSAYWQVPQLSGPRIASGWTAPL